MSTMLDRSRSAAASLNLGDNAVRKLLIGGAWVDALDGGVIETRNPANGMLLARVAAGTAKDIDRAVASARSAFDGPWKHAKPAERQRILLKFADLVEKHFDELARLDILDMGVPISVMQTRRARAAATIRFYAGAATMIAGDTPQNSIPGDFFTYTVKEPVGVVGAIMPWNSPLMHAIWKIGPVVATGCTLVLKPAEQAPLTPLRLGELLLEAGLPEGVVNVVAGDGSAGAALAAHMDVDKIAFTGSHLTGQRIIEASKGNIKRVTLELGGKSPDIVFDDANLDEAVPGAAMAVFANSGQICFAGTRLLVQRDIHDEFVERLGAFARGLRVGDGLDAETQIGPLVSQAQLDRVQSYLDLGPKEGASIVAGGGRSADKTLKDGYFVEPTVLSNVTNDMRVAQDEIFGPVVAVMPFDTEEDATRIANATMFGLGSGVWTGNLGRAHRMAAALRSGTVWVNCYSQLDPAVPFGGYKMSGYGRELGRQHVEAYVQEKSVYIRTG